MTTGSESSMSRLDPWTRLLLSALLLLAAAVFTVSGDAWHVGVMTLVAVAGAAMFPTLEFRSRPLIYAVLAVLIALTILDQTAPVRWGRFFFMPSNVLCPFFLFSGAAGLYFRRHEAVVGWVVGCALMALFLAGFVVEPPSGLPRLGLEGQQLWVCRHFFVWYAMVVVASMALLLLVLARHGRRLRTSVSPGGWRRPAWLAVAFVLSLAVMQGLTTAMKSQEMRMRRLFLAIFQLDLPRPREPGGVDIADRINLRHPSPLLRDDDLAVVLRVKAAAIPGYLRTRAFTAYRDGCWEKNSSPSRQLPQLAAEGELAFTIFTRAVAGGPGDAPAAGAGAGVERQEIYPAARLEVLPAPGDATAFEMFAEQLGENDDGVLEPAKWRSQSGCVVVRTGNVVDSAFPGPTGSSPGDDYLAVPPEIAPGLDRWLETALGTGQEAAGDRRTMARVMAFFHRNFAYDLHASPAPEEVDPVLAFLDGPRRGHCELFASATVLLLRRAGVPARYVTGFLCRERLRFGGYWVSRLRDAHAWVEAYDRDKGQWVLVESTPGTAADLVAPQAGVNPFQALWDSLKFHWQRLNAMLRRGHVAVVVMIGVGLVLTSLQWLFFHPWLAPVTWPLSLWLLWRWTRRRWLKRRQGGLDGPRGVLSRSYRDICRTLQRRGVVVTPDMTPAELAASCQNHGLSAWAELLELFGQMRYAAGEPRPEQVADFLDKVRTAQKQTR